MNVPRRLARLSRRIGRPLILRYDPDGRGAYRDPDAGRPDEGQGAWTVIIDEKAGGDYPSTRSLPYIPHRFDGLYAAETPDAAVRGAEEQVDRRLHDAAARIREDKEEDLG